MGVAAGPEGVEVMVGGPTVTGAEFGVAMGAAAGVAVHGPAPAARHLAGSLVEVSWHVILLSFYYSTNVLF